MTSGAAPTPRRRLDREAVEAAAEAIVDRDGWEQLTMSQLARELDVKVSSLYSHVPSLDALLGDLQVRCMRELSGQIARAAMGTVGPPAIRVLAEALRGYALAHPGRYDLTMREPHDRKAVMIASAGAADALTAVIASFGIDDPNLELMLAAFASLHGVLSLELAGLYRNVVDTEPVYDHVVDLVVLMLERRRDLALVAG